MFPTVIDDESMCGYLQQAKELHFEDGTHKLDEPVSNITLKGWPGVPIVMSP